MVNPLWRHGSEFGGELRFVEPVTRQQRQVVFDHCKVKAGDAGLLCLIHGMGHADFDRQTPATQIRQQYIRPTTTQTGLKLSRMDFEPLPG